MELLDYLDPDGRDLFDEWFTQLDPQARAKVTTHLIRLSRGNLSGVKAARARWRDYKQRTKK